MYKRDREIVDEIKQSPKFIDNLHAFFNRANGVVQFSGDLKFKI